MKGKTTIQLFDAKTKKETHRTGDCNLITNAYKKYIEDYLKYYRIGHLTSSSSEWFSARPIDFAKGIILFGQQLPEDPNIIYPTNQQCVGHAGSAYSGTDPYRGNFNEVESGEIENGYRFVWDFPTDKANGTIACACLTTRQGGNFGYMSEEIPAGYSDYGTQGISNTSKESYIIFMGSDSLGFVGFTNDNSTAYTQTRPQNTAQGYVSYVRKYSTNNSSIAFTDYPALFFSPYTDIPYETYEIGLPDNNTYLCLFTDENNIYGLHHNTSTKNSALKTYDAELNETSCLSLEGTNLLSYNIYMGGVANCAIMDGVLYAKRHQESDIYMYDMVNGAYLGVIAPPITSTNSWVCKFSNNLIRILDLITQSYYLYNGEFFYGPFATTTTAVTRYTKLLTDNSPLYVTGGNTSSNRIEISFGVFGPVLGSINNLSTPIVKDDTKTMKVTYDITW